MFSPQLPVPAGRSLSAVVVITGHRPGWCIVDRRPYDVVYRIPMPVVRMLRLSLMGGNYEIDGGR